MPYIALLGRILFSILFILASLGHFNEESIQYAASEGVPFPSILVPLSGILCLLGGLSILLGYKPRIGGWLIVIFLVPVTFMMHRFWNVEGPIEAMIQQIMFLKNLALIGAALLIAYFGSGPLSLDSR